MKANKKIAVYTAIINNYDGFIEPEFVDSNIADYHIFTDNKDFRSEKYKVHYIIHLGNNFSWRESTLTARAIKILGHEYLPGYGIYVWHDANIIQKRSIHPLISRLYKDNLDIIILKHNCRNCLYEEANACIDIDKDKDFIIKEQIERYRKDNYPENNGLLASGLIIRTNNKDINETFNRWYEEIKKGSIRDQLSFNYIINKRLLDDNVLHPVLYLNYETIKGDYFNYVTHADTRKLLKGKRKEITIKKPKEMKRKKENIKTRTDIINYYAEKIGAKSYLEIGYGDGNNFASVNVENKISIDPSPIKEDKNPKVIKLKSDDFFKNNESFFDIIFIDGLHHSEQVYRDINNALKFINQGGVIVCHDMLPVNELCQKVPREVKEWTGDCWKAWAWLRTEREDLGMFVVNKDYGCGVIYPGEKQDKYKIKKGKTLNYKYFEENKKELMNIVENVK